MGFVRLRLCFFVFALLGSLACTDGAALEATLPQDDLIESDEPGPTDEPDLDDVASSGDDSPEVGDDESTPTEVDTETDALCEVGEGLAGQDVVLTFPWDGELRTWTLHLPSDYDCTPRPLLIGAHAYLSDGHQFQHDVANIFDHINEHGYIGIFPDAMARGASDFDSGVTSFNDITSHYDDGPDGPTCTVWSWDYGIFENCPASETERFCRWGTSCSDDVGFFRALIAEVSTRWTVDPDRIYMTGFSQGAISTQSFACPLSDILAAVAPLHGASANGHTCGPETKVSMMQVWGVNDIGINGHEEPSIDGLIYDGATETAAIWAQAQGCDEQPTLYSTVSDGKWGWSCTEHAGCETEADVVTCQWDGNHIWGRTPTDGDFMWDAVWDFLKSHSR